MYTIIILKGDLLLLFCMDLQPELEVIKEFAQGQYLVQEKIESRHR